MVGRDVVASAAFAAWMLVSSIGLAANPYLVKDIDETVIRDQRSLCGQPVGVGDRAYFCAGTDFILTSSDGTEVGTRPLEDADGNHFRYVDSLVASNGLLYFVARDGFWVTDGTPAGTRLLRDENGDIFPGGSRWVPYDGGLFVFDGGSALWQTDGSVVRLVKSLPGTWLEQAAMVGSDLYFIDYEHRLWKSDGTTAGTVLVRDLPYLSTLDLTRFADVDGTLFFTLQDDAYNVDLWKSDGTAAGTVLVKASPVGTYFPIEGLTAIGGLLYFVGNRVNYTDLEFWVSDGTDAGTRRITVIPNGGGFNDAFALNGRYVVTAGDVVWSSDGTEAGTLELFRDSQLGYRDAAVYRGLLLFSGDDGGGLGEELWRTDGTPAGTWMVRDIGWGAKSSSPHYLAAIDTGVLFEANKGDHLGGDSLWITDATREGTRLVADLAQNTEGSFPSQFTRVGDVVYFLANMTVSTNLYQQWELWRTDGSADGTRQVVNLVEERTITFAEYGGEYGEMIAFDGLLYFVGRTDAGWYLWNTDGTASGTRAVALGAGETASAITELTQHDGRLYFLAETPAGTGLWSLAAGETKARQVQADLVGPTGLLAFAGQLYFANNGNEIWRTDGRDAGAVPVVSITRGLETSIVELEPVNDGLFTFRVLWEQDWPENRYNRAALWVSDGTLDGTYEVTSPYPYDSQVLIADGAIWFEALDGLWIHDGSSRDSTLLIEESARQLVRVGDVVYFYKYEFGELWVSDGTPQGTHAVVSRVELSSPIVGIDGSVYFSAYDSLDDQPWSGYDGNSLALRRLRDDGTGADVLVPGLRLVEAVGGEPGRSFIARTDDRLDQFWVTDGTPEGTEQVTRFDRLRVYRDRIQLGDSLLMSLDAENWGFELWGYALDQAPDVVIPCGQPTRVRDGAHRVYAWNWCDSDRWVVEVTQDSDSEVRYSGSVSTDTGLLGGLNLQQLEPHDVVSLDPAATGIDFLLRLWSGTDRFAFTAPADGTLCLSLQGAVDAQLFLGPDARPASGNVDLRTGKPCSP